MAEPHHDDALALGLTTILAHLDAAAATAALDAAFDKFVDDQETGVMVDDLVDAFPGLAAVVARLDERIREEQTDTELGDQIVIGCAIGLLTVVQYAHAADLRRQVLGPAVPDPPGC